MTKLPVVSGRDAVRAFGKLGYAFDRSAEVTSFLRQVAPPHRRLAIPDHKELGKGTLRTLLREAGLNVGEFTKLL